MLHWPTETVVAEDSAPDWHQSDSNIVLDFHGDPIKAGLAVFSDGNHHMALLPALRAFKEVCPQVGDIFYATTPPAPIVAFLRAGALRLGNLVLSIKPHVFISPPHVLERLAAAGLVQSHCRLARNQGSVLLIHHGNPKGIHGIADLLRPDVRLFISNPRHETVSYDGYRRTLEGMAAREGIALEDFRASVLTDTVVLGERIHHREAPEALAAGTADAAIVYYHLALRYTRIFSDMFDFIPLGGTRTHPEPHPGNGTADIHIGLVGNGGPWGARCLAFMLDHQAGGIYREHGLVAEPTIKGEGKI